MSKLKKKIISLMLISIMMLSSSLNIAFATTGLEQQKELDVKSRVEKAEEGEEEEEKEEEEDENETRKAAHEHAESIAGNTGIGLAARDYASGANANPEKAIYEHLNIGNITIGAGEKHLLDDLKLQYAVILEEIYSGDGDDEVKKVFENSIFGVGDEISDKIILGIYYSNTLEKVNNLEYSVYFINMYYRQFMGMYTGAYATINADLTKDNLTRVNITGHGGTLEFKDRLTSILGSSDGSTVEYNEIDFIKMEIPKGTFYVNSFLSIAKEKDSFGKYMGYYDKDTNEYKQYKPASNIYTIKVENDRGNAVVLDSDITITFSYSGNERLGVYELSDYANGGNTENKWKYINTEQNFEDETVTIKLPKGTTYKGGKYALYIDETYSNFVDTQLNWASDEIYNFLRRGYIKGYGDGTFRPYNNISRAEFLIMSGRILGWDYGSTVENGSYLDRDQFWIYENAINYASSKGYINGYADGTFRAYNNITYKEVELIVGRILHDPQFSWGAYADLMKSEKFKYSDSYTSMNNLISRDEIVYMYFNLEKEKKILN